MKTLVMALALFGASFAVAAAMPQSVQFRGLVRSNDGVPTRFDVQVPSGQRVVLTLGDGSRLELATVGAGHGARTPMARLVSASGKTLHTARFGDRGLASVSLDYLVCDGRATYMSPAPAKLPSCSHR